MLLILALFGLFNPTTARAQLVVSGVVKDGKDGSAIDAVNITLTPFRDSLRNYGGITGAGGFFSIQIPPGLYRATFNFVGYQTFDTIIGSKADNINLGTILLFEEAKDLKTAVVEAKIKPVTQNNDTTEFNARSFKVNQNATAEDLVKKMPGITQENGVIKAQGEEVKKVLVDGREFFGDDASMALKNLPAEVIDRVQVFDRMSDQSRFTGFDDGNSQKALNIITRPGMNNGTFGKLYGGYGTEKHYESGLSLNKFKGFQRISLLGMSNNINQQNFSSQDLMGVFGNTGQRRWGGPGGGGRPGSYGSSGMDASGFMVGQQGGISATSNTGINYSNMFGKKVSLNASYFFNYTDNAFANKITRNYFVSDGESQTYTESTANNTFNYNHRVAVRMEITADSSNSIILSPRFSLQQAMVNNSLDGVTRLKDLLLNSSLTKNRSESEGYYGSNSVLWVHKMKKPGRNYSLQVNNDFNNSNANGKLLAANSYQSLQTLLQQQNSSLNRSQVHAVTLTYSEPIGSKLTLMLNINPSVALSSNNKQTFSYDTLTGIYSVVDSVLSSNFDNKTISNRLGGNIRYKGARAEFFTGIYLQQVNLISDQTFPRYLGVDKVFRNVLPMGMFRYNFSNTRTLRIFSRSWTQTPQLSQLQTVVNNSNPLLLSTGNANLKQQVSYMLVGRFNTSNTGNASSFQLYLYAQNARNYIANSSLIATSDTVVNNDIALRRGAQLAMPVNLSGYWNLRSVATWAFPVKKIKSNLSFNAGATYNKIPGLVNGLINNANTYNVNSGFVLGSNISKDLDFMFTYSLNYNWVFNSILPAQNNNYLVQNGLAKINYTYKNRLVLTSDLNMNRYNGLSVTFNQQIWLWNAGVAYRFLKSRNAEIRLIAFDILKQNRAITRTVYETYIEDANTTVLTRYLMLSAVYNIRNFKPMKAPAAK